MASTAPVDRLLFIKSLVSNVLINITVLIFVLLKEALTAVPFWHQLFCLLSWWKWFYCFLESQSRLLYHSGIRHRKNARSLVLVIPATMASAWPAWTALTAASKPGKDFSKGQPLFPATLSKISNINSFINLVWVFEFEEGHCICCIENDFYSFSLCLDSQGE